MLALRPNFGRIISGSVMNAAGGAGPIGDYFLHEESPGMYRISSDPPDVTLVEEAPDMWRFSDDPLGTGAIISVGGFFMIYG